VNYRQWGLPMILFTMLLAFLPSVWIAYGLSRWGLSFTGLDVLDQVAMSFLAALVAGGCAALLGWEQKDGPPRRLWPFG
jgi:hypothetical protein